MSIMLMKPAKRLQAYPINANCLQMMAFFSLQSSTPFDFHLNHLNILPNPDNHGKNQPIPPQKSSPPPPEIRPY